MGSLNILALCDGHSGGQIALTELGVSINQYYASEIDKFAIQQTQHNFPKTIQLGDIENWRTWDIDFKSIDLILAGTPCQGFSFAGKQLAFDDPRSRLFFVFVDILNHIRKLNPDVKFLLENVKMKKSHLEVISRYTGVFPVRINSNLVSAQNRDRWYWTNVKTKEAGLFGEVYSDIPQPKDRGVLLRDILEKDVNEKYYISQSVIDRMNRKQYSKPAIDPDKTGALNTKNNSGQMSIDSGTTFISVYGKVPTQRSPTGRSLDKKHNFQFIKIDKQGNPKKNQDKGGLHQDKTPTLTKNSWEQNNLVVQLNPSTESGGKQPYQHNRVYADYGKKTCLDTDAGRKSVYTDYRIRRLTPTECARLQTIPDWYKWVVSDTQIYKQCGNGWTIEVIKHLLSQWDLVNELVLTEAI